MFTVSPNSINNSNSNQFMTNFLNPNFAGNNWANGYTAYSNNNSNQSPKTTNMYNIVFKTSDGRRFNIPFDSDRTVEDLIHTFFKRVDREELFTKGGISFLYNASTIDYNNENSIKQFFRSNQSPTVVVIDIQGLIGA